MSINEKIALLAELFELEENKLTPGTILKELDEWDSITGLSLIVLMENTFNKDLTGEQVRAFKTVQDILDYMEK